MGVEADNLTEEMLDAKILHDNGECDEYCEWCREDENDET